MVLQSKMVFSRQAFFSALVALALFCGSAFAQSVPIFSHAHYFSRTGFNVAVQAITTQPDGKAIVGGSFHLANGTPRTNLARFNTDGSVDMTWNATTNGDVNAVLHAGGITYVSGNFTTAGGQPRNYAAAFDATGQVTPWNPGLDGPATRMVVFNGQIVLAGNFYTVGGVARNGLASVDTTGTLTAWNPDNDDVANDLHLGAGNLYVLGRFTSMGGMTRSGAASFDASFNLRTWAPSLSNAGFPASTIHAAVDDTYLLVVGGFNQVNGNPHAGAVRIDLGSGADSQLSLNGLSASASTIRSITAISNKLFLGGNIYLNAAFQNGLAGFDLTTGDALSNLPTITSDSSNVLTLHAANGRLWLGGQFDTLGGVDLSGLGSVDIATPATVAPYFLSAVTSNPVTSFARQFDGKVVIGGAFDMVNGIRRKSLVRLNVDGSVDASWVAGIEGADARVLTLVHEGARLLIGGEFEKVNGVNRSFLAALDDNGALLPWNPAPNGSVRVIKSDGGIVYVAGDFTMVGGTSQRGLSQLDGTTGAIATAAFGNYGTAANGFPVNAIDVRGGVYVAGSFDHVQGLLADGITPRHFRSLASLNAADGSFLAAWNPPIATVMNLTAVHATAQRVYVSGSFTSIAGQPRAGLAAFNTTTGVLESWNPNVPPATSSTTPFVLNDVLYSTSGAYDTTINSNNRLNWGIPSVAVASGGDRVYYLGEVSQSAPKQFAFGAVPLAASASAAVSVAVVSVNGGSDPGVSSPFNVVVQSRDAANLPRPVIQDTTLVASVNSGTGALGGGTSSCTLLAGTSQCTFSALTYSKGEANVRLAIARTTGDALTSTLTAPFNVKRNVSMTLAKSPSGVTEVGTPATFVATIVGGVSPGGTVAFMGNSAGYPAVTECQMVPVIAGVATCVSSTIPAIFGLTLRAIYSGDATHFGVTSLNDEGAAISAYPSIQVNKIGGGAGTVTSTPSGISCGTACQFSVPGGTTVTLSAVAELGSSFLGWGGGGCTGTSPCTLTLPVGAGDTTITARFEPPNQTLNIMKVGTGSGSVSSTPAGIQCGVICSAGFPTDQSVDLTATPSSDSIFTGWSGAGCSGTGVCTVTMGASHTVTAQFDLKPQRSLSITPPGNGIVTADMGGLSCPGVCSANIPQGTVVTLTATPNAGYYLETWTGACSGTGACAVTLNGNENVSAQFALVPELVSVQSIKTHGTLGALPISIALGVPIGGAITFEPRLTGVAHELRVGLLPFVNSISSVEILDAAGQVAGAALAEFTPGGSEMTLRLSGVADGTRARVRIGNVNGSSIDLEFAMGFLVGDVGGTGRVTAADIAAIKARNNQFGTSAPARDLNLSGTIDATDVIVAKSLAGRATP